MIKSWFAAVTLLAAIATAADRTEQQRPVEKPQSALPQAVTDQLRAADGHLAAGATPARYTLKNGDTFEVAFPLTPEFNQSVTVQPDGYISLTDAGELLAAGKTIPELRALLQHSYSSILHDPIINVVVRDFEKPYFIASGELAHPGKYELRDTTTVTEAIAIAGGFTEDSKHNQVIVFRRVSNDWIEVKECNVKNMLRAHNLGEDLALQPGDMLFVPRNRMSAIRKYIPNPGVGMTAVY